MSQAYLQTNALTKAFDAGHGAFDISMQLFPGEIVGFIGPNGAGKTTTMRMLMQLLHQDSGSLSLFGKQITSGADIRLYMPRIGFMPGEPNFYPQLTAGQLFDYASKLYGRDLSAHARKLAAELDLDVQKPFKYLSLGNRKKVGFIHAVMHDPDLLILDEPTSGLDPLIQQKVLAQLRQARAEGKCVLLSSHTLSEVQQICDRIIMIKSGRIILEDTTRNIQARAVKIFRLPAISSTMQQEIANLSGVRELEHAGDETLVYASDPKTVIDYLTTHQQYDFYLERASLEDMFLKEYRS